MSAPWQSFMSADIQTLLSGAVPQSQHNSFWEGRDNSLCHQLLVRNVRAALIRGVVALQV
jgi:hypothetical protein